ncbi:MAG: hypothetical protein BWX88_05100 [Planctomycetes bacterium ADurb.Bin126]|nr:MAG: hypothetical protein BWX88_05100 [Planctomycetes bacterium ADurb.Bin126]HOD84731.1 hypothetical protein [Phycisphaerae bacterium]
MKQYQPLEIGLIDEGRFLAQANADLREMQAKLCAYVAEHAERAKGGKATLTISVTLAVDNPDDDLFTVKSQTKMTMPQRPASVTMAISDEDGDGKSCLHVRRTGSDRTTPKQGKFCRDDGTIVTDPTPAESA